MQRRENKRQEVKNVLQIPENQSKRVEKQKTRIKMGVVYIAWI